MAFGRDSFDGSVVYGVAQVGDVAHFPVIDPALKCATGLIGFRKPVCFVPPADAAPLLRSSS